MGNGNKNYRNEDVVPVCKTKNFVAPTPAPPLPTPTPTPEPTPEISQMVLGDGAFLVGKPGDGACTAPLEMMTQEDCGLTMAEYNATLGGQCQFQVIMSWGEYSIQPGCSVDRVSSLFMFNVGGGNQEFTSEHLVPVCKIPLDQRTTTSTITTSTSTTTSTTATTSTSTDTTTTTTRGRIFLSDGQIRVGKPFARQCEGRWEVLTFEECALAMVEYNASYAVCEEPGHCLFQVIEGSGEYSISLGCSMDWTSSVFFYNQGDGNPDYTSEVVVPVCRDKKWVPPTLAPTPAPPTPVPTPTPSHVPTPEPTRLRLHDGAFVVGLPGDGACAEPLVLMTQDDCILAMAEYNRSYAVCETADQCQFQVLRASGAHSMQPGCSMNLLSFNFIYNLDEGNTEYTNDALVPVCRDPPPPTPSPTPVPTPEPQPVFLKDGAFMVGVLGDGRCTAPLVTLTLEECDRAVAEYNTTHASCAGSGQCEFHELWAEGPQSILPGCSFELTNSVYFFNTGAGNSQYIGSIVPVCKIPKKIRTTTTITTTTRTNIFLGDGQFSVGVPGDGACTGRLKTMTSVQCRRAMEEYNASYAVCDRPDQCGYHDLDVSGAYSILPGCSVDLVNSAFLFNAGEGNLLFTNSFIVPVCKIRRNFLQPREPNAEASPGPDELNAVPISAP